MHSPDSTWKPNPTSLTGTSRVRTHSREFFLWGSVPFSLYTAELQSDP